MFPLLLVFLICKQTLGLPNVGIHGGLPAELGQYPYQVAIRECYDKTDPIFHGYCTLQCGGTLISPTWVMTTAYCVESVSQQLNILTGTLTVENVTANAQSFSVKRSFKHPGYVENDYVSAHNLALIELSKAVNIDMASKPAKLPSSNEKPTGEMVISGWGAYQTIPEHNNNIFPKILLDAKVVIANDTKTCCNEFNEVSSWSINSSSEKYICTRPRSPKEISNICSRDTGGPLANNGVVYGVALYGYGRCDIPGSPSVFVKISDHVDWIKSYVKDV